MDTTVEQSRALFFTGIEHFENGRLEPARECFEQSLSLTPGRPSVQGNLGITLFHLQRLDEAIPHLQTATAADPQHAEAWACLGLAHAALGDWQAAAEALGKAVELQADKPGLWLSRGQCLLRLGRVEAALDAFDRALAIDPQFAPAWSERGSLMREVHRLDEAARCFEKALEYGADPELHRYYLASVRGTTAPVAPPRQYVEALFDDYAADFQGHLVEKLGYRGFEILLRPLIAANRRYGHVLDLGCGTGLCGPLIRPLADSVDGVDVSAAMLEQARALGVYRDMVHADLGEFLAVTGQQADLVLAADVFVYVGELDNIFRSVRRILRPGGCFAFTVEESGDGQDMHLLSSLRYAHSENYVRRLASEYGFEVRDVVRAPIRHDQTKPIPGLYVYLE